MAKKIIGQIKLQIPAGQANPAPPVGPALGQQGVNIMAFCKEFNATTKEQAGMIIPVVITVYADKSFTFITKSPPASVLLKKAAGIASGSKVPNKDKVGKVTRKQVLEIVGLQDHANRNAGKFSRGMLQRVGLAHDLVKRVEQIEAAVMADREAISIHSFGNGLHFATTAIRKDQFPSVGIARVDDRSNERFKHLEHESRR